MMVNSEGKPSAVLHSRFDEAATDANGYLQVGKFASRALVAKGEVSAVIERMSEQVLAARTRIPCREWN
jgi:hypothetical protein